MAPRTSKNSATVPTSPPKSHRSGRKHAASSVDATVEPAAKKVAMDSEAGALQSPIGDRLLVM